MASFFSLSSVFDVIDRIINECTQSISIQWTRDGNITISASMLGDGRNVIDSLNISKRDIEIKGWSKSGSVTTITLVDKTDRLIKDKIKKSAIFKSVYKGFIDLHETGIIPTDIIDPTTMPDADVYIRECNSPYESDGWTVREIFRELGIDLYFPSGWNYHVTKLVVRAGVPVVSFIQSVFPFPDMLITRIGGGRLAIISQNARCAPVVGDECMTALKVETTTICSSIKGDLGEIKYIRETKETGQSSEYSSKGVSASYVKNLIGGIFLVTKVNMTDDFIQLPTDLWNPVASV